MSVDVHEIDAEGLGGHSAERYAATAIAGAKALIESDPSQERWVLPLVRAIRRGERDNLEEEFADVYAWLATLASIHGIDLEEIGRKKYGEGCPKCSAVPCDC